MRCFHCRNTIKDESKAILLGCDGDFVCNQKCKDGYEEEKAHFLNDIVHSAEKTEAWLLGNID